MLENRPIMINFKVKVAENQNLLKKKKNFNVTLKMENL